MATSSREPDGGRSAPQMRAEIVFLLLDGLRRSRPGAAEAVLCALGLTREGTPHPLAMRVVPQEDERAWRLLLGDLKADGIGPDLLLVCSDGHPALVKAIHATHPETPQQISVAHRLLALARKVDARWRSECLAEARRIFAAPDRAAAVALFRDWHARWLRQREFAVRSLEADLASCLTFYRFPANLWSKIRTVNLVERVFRDARRTALPAVPAAPAERDESTEAEAASRTNGEPTPPAWETGLAFPTKKIPLPLELQAEWELGEATPDVVTAAPDAAEPATTENAEAGPISTDLPTEFPRERAIPAAPAGDQAAHSPEAIVLHVSHLREAEAVVLQIASAAVPEPAAADPAPSARPPTLSSAEGFEDWLQTYHRQAVRMKIVMTFTSVAGLLAGLALALSR